MSDEIFTYAFLIQTIRISIPYLLPSAGAVYSEKSGVINLALEGYMLIGAFAAAAGIYYSGNIFIGVIIAVLTAVVISLVQAYISVSTGANQIVTGIAINILAVGATKYSCKLFFGSSSNSERIVGLEVLGFDPFIILSVLAVALSWIVLYKSRFGLRLRACGENPDAASSLGVDVTKVRYQGVIISGIFASLGGVYLALGQHSFTDGMVAGRGYIAIAAMIVGKWNPVGAAFACLFFGITESLSIHLQGSSVPTQFIQMIPYVLTIIVLAGFVGKAKPPRALGLPLKKEL